MQVPLSVPPHCRITKLRIVAETEEAFDKACEQFDVKPLETGPIGLTRTSAYTFRFARTKIEGMELEIDGPQKMHTITLVADA